MPERTPRILIVDDREENRYVLQRVLERAGYDCEVASTGHAGIDRLATVPDVVILDVHLPDISGYEVCHQIKYNPKTAHIPVLQISASFLSSEDKARALEAGADAYLTHPIDGVVLLATVRSLLRLKAVEARVRESAAQWQASFDALSEGLAFIDNQGKLARFNHAFAHLAGLDFPADSQHDAALVLHRLLGTAGPLNHANAGRYSAEFTADLKTIQVTLDQIRTDEGDAGKILVLTDVTDRRLAEYALRTAEQLAAAGKLANAIAHEINNPLEALVNLVYLAQNSKSMPDVQYYLASASDEVDRIARITKQSLSFHRDTESAVPLDVGGLMEDVVSLYKKAAAARRIEIMCDRKPTLSIHGFPGQLRQVFGNLLRNATEASPPDSTIVVRVRPASRRGGAGTLVTIHDRGSGIPEDLRPKLFDPFFTTKELKGSGLGLWVSKALVVKHRGSIRFRSCAGKPASGTSFEVFLPVGELEHQTDDTAAYSAA